jgi:hypothetical protein
VTPEDRKRFLEVVVGFAELKGKQLSAPALELYWRSLQHWPLGDFLQAAEHLIRTCEFMPLPKDFEDLRRAGRPTAGEAWTRAVASCGSCREISRAMGAHYGNGGTCGDPFIDRVVRAIGGYKTIAMCDSEKLHFLERRFAEHFETMQSVADVREEVPQIAHQARAFISGPRRISDIGGDFDDWSPNGRS